MRMCTCVEGASVSSEQGSRSGRIEELKRFRHVFRSGTIVVVLLTLLACVSVHTLSRWLSIGYKRVVVIALLCVAARVLSSVRGILQSAAKPTRLEVSVLTRCSWLITARVAAAVTSQLFRRGRPRPRA